MAIPYRPKKKNRETGERLFIDDANDTVGRRGFLLIMIEVRARIRKKRGFTVSHGWARTATIRFPFALL